MKIGLVSLYGNPIHFGHIEYLQAAKDRSDILCVIVNNDKQVELKGSKPFMDQEHRLSIIKALACVDFAIVSIDQDSSVSESIALIYEINKTACKPSWLRWLSRIMFGKDEFTFYNSGDRNPANFNKKENGVCDRLGIHTEFIDLPKIYSSSELVK